MKLPSRKILPLLLASIFAVGAIGAATWSKGKSASYEAPTGLEPIVEAVVKQTSGIDSDNDGLKNWEESLWNTNPELADTDGDGTSDGEEVVANRDPSKKGPGDEIKEDSGAGFTATATPPHKLTLTDKFSRELFSQYLFAKQQGKEVDEATQIRLLQNFLLSNPSGAVKRTAQDIKVGEETASSVRSYGNSLGRAINTAPSPGPENELVVFERAYTSLNEAELAKLDPIIRMYEAILRGFSDTRAPAGIAPLHLDTVNNLESIVYSLKSFKSLFTDPVKAMQGLVTYTESFKAWKGNFEALDAYFLKKGVIFQQSEDGYILGSII